jgi:outer membrane protein TolC
MPPGIFLALYAKQTFDLKSFIMTNLLAKTALGAVLALLLLPFGAIAQTGEERTLTLDEVVQLGLANSKQLRISMARSEIAQSRTKQALASTIPSLTYTGSYYRLSDNITPFETPLFSIPILLNQTLNRVSLSEPVFTGLRALNTIRATEFLEKAAQFDYERDKKEVQVNLLATAIQVYKLEEARKVVQRSLATAQNRLKDTRALQQQGIVLENDVLKSELSITQLETAQLETDNNLAASRYALNTLLGLPAGTTLHIDSTSIGAGAGAETLASFTENTTQRADYQAATQRMLASEKQVKVSQGAYLPLISIGANLYSNNPNQRQFPVEDRFITTWDAGVQVTWNLSNLYTSRNNVQEARLNLLQAGAQRDQVLDAAGTEVSNNFFAWQTAQQKIALSEKAVMQALENQRIMQLRNSQQLSSLTDLLDADSLLLQAQINQVTAKADAYLSRVRLLRSAGKL